MEFVQGQTGLVNTRILRVFDGMQDKHPVVECNGMGPVEAPMPPYTHTAFQADTERQPRKQMHANARAEDATHQHERRAGANTNAGDMLDGSGSRPNHPRP